MQGRLWELHFRCLALEVLQAAYEQPAEEVAFAARAIVPDSLALPAGAAWEIVGIAALCRLGASHNPERALLQAAAAAGT